MESSMTCVSSSPSECSCTEEPPRLPDPPVFFGVTTTPDPSGTTTSAPITGSTNSTADPTPLTTPDTGTLDPNTTIGGEFPTSLITTNNVTDGVVSGPSTTLRSSPTTNPNTITGSSGSSGTDSTQESLPSTISSTDKDVSVSGTSSYGTPSAPNISWTSAPSSVTTGDDSLPTQGFITSPTNGTGDAIVRNQSLIIGLSVGVSILVILAIILIIWWCYDRGKLCFEQESSEIGSVASSSKQKDVELITVRKGTMIVQPSPPLPSPNSTKDPPSHPPDPGNNAPISKDNDLTPVESSDQLRKSAALAGSNSQPSRQAGHSATPQPTQDEAATQQSRTKKKRKSKRNRVSPEEASLPSIKGPKPPP